MVDFERSRPLLQLSQSVSSLDVGFASRAPAATLGEFDVAIFREYLERLLPLVLSASPDDLADSLLSHPKFDEHATKFGTDPNCMVAYIYKVREIDPALGADGDADVDELEPHFSYTISSEMTYSPNDVSTLTFIKRVPSIDTLRPIDVQLHFLNLFGPASTDRVISAGNGNVANKSGANPYEALHSLVHLAVAPFFDAYVNSKSARRVAQDGVGKSKDADAKMGIPMTRKKFAELELSLLHLQQNVEIPDISLSIHPVVQRAVEHCRREGIKVSYEVIDANLFTEDAFLNKIQSEVNSWIKEIQNVTKLNRDVASGTASQEINFWLSMEKALEAIEDQLRSDPIVLTLDILKHAKRFHATVSFIADTGLKEATDIVHKYNQLMKDFPLNELLAATDLEKVQASLTLIFAHIMKKLKGSPYPIRRALPLVEAISRDLSETLLKVLSSQRLMYMEYPSFERTMVSAAAAFETWDEQIKDFTNVAREVTRKRSEKFLAIKINPAHAPLRERCEYLRQFRKQHEQLRVMTGRDKGIGGSIGLVRSGAGGAEGAVPTKASGLTDVNMEDEVRAAYECVKNVEVLDTTIGGTEIWVTAETAYNERVARVENQIIAQLRDRLAAARNANEMFRVFSKFNALFVRPKIRGAIQEYQAQLIDSVKEDIRRLHDKFKTQYPYSEACHMSQLRDLPPVSGAITWVKQIERQLYTYMKRVEDVLGKGWECYTEGQKLQAESNSFRRKLETRPIFETWQADVARRDLQISGRIFDITWNRSLGVYQLSVTFDSQNILIFKEVRNLLWLGFSVPHQVSSIAKEAKRVYPHAVSLVGSVRTYSQTVVKVDATPGIAMLLAEYRHDVQQMINKGMSLRWEQFVTSYVDVRHHLPSMPASALDTREGRYATFVREFANAISVFQDRTDSVIQMYEEILRIVEELNNCEFKQEVFAGLLSQIQKTIDLLNLEGYANLVEWVSVLDKRIEAVFLKRIQAVMQVWNDQFSLTEGKEGTRKDNKTATLVERKTKLTIGTKVMESGLRVTPLVHEIRIKNQIIYLDPPIEHARADWSRQLHEWLGVICHLTRIQSQRYEIGLNIRMEEPEDRSYASLLGLLPEAVLQKPYALVESKVAEISAYLAKWLQFQSLWDLEPDYVYNRLGESLSAWQQLLSEIRKTRATFDNSETSRAFGVAVINYEQVQAKVNAKYDTWQRDILARFGSKLASIMRETHAAITKARHDLEVQTIETATTSQAVNLITFVSDLKSKVKKWTPEIELFGVGQKTLERQRYQFPADWLHVDQIEGEWSAFTDILTKRNAMIQEQLAGLQLKIVGEDKVIQSKIEAAIEEWDKNKPIQGSLKADIAINSIGIYEGRIGRLKEDYNNLCQAKEALDLEHTREDRLSSIVEEIRDLKAVWTALSGIWAQISELRETPWSSVTSRKLRQSLDGLLTATRDMPSRMRQYAAFEYVQDTIRQYQKGVALVGELKSDALRERHWRQLYKNLRLAGHYSPSQMTLGTIWEMDLKRNETAIREILVQATGEVALEEYLKLIKETWSNYTLDLVNYQNKTRLIRGWDDIFTKCGEHTNALTQMKMSPYFKTFEEDALAWEDKLTRVHALFDVWIDVQRQWVYLEGIFTGSADIKHLLPVETNRFNGINGEFMTVMKKVFKSPFVMDVLNIPNCLKSLERLADMLSKIQKALGEYLERERSSFPRFYFVGDEDLLEIIGNSKDILRVVKHLKKMFAGISTLLFDEDVTQIEGMASREGEEIRFLTPILLKDFPKINDWLAKLESHMKSSLAQLLTSSAGDLSEFYTEEESLDTNRLMSWTEQYPAQLVVLACQIQWTTLVETALQSSQSLSHTLNVVLRTLDVLAAVVLGDLHPIMRRKCEHMITELVHQRDVTRQLIQDNVSQHTSFDWLYHMRFYLDNSKPDPIMRLSIEMANAKFPYGFEYLGVPDRLVQTPLTDRCYLTLTQALHGRLGGSPFGPAGTGKTESVKALGVQLGRFVLVFCCDETFDFQAMGRIFVGLCQVGAWGCFDEANRLEERILSAVSQQIQSIQQGLKALVTNSEAEVELVGKTLRINPHTGIFITMNPGYAGRSNLPDNLKKLFRSMAMTRPDRELIAQVMLFSQGFRTAETLASKVVPFFSLCEEQLSRQPHYDFGLRALKAVLVSAGHLKRGRLQSTTDEAYTDAANEVAEQEILIQSVTETIVPKLVADDVPLLTSLLADVFPGVDYIPSDLSSLVEHIKAVATEQHLVVTDIWLQKVIQLYQIQSIQHGLMMVGPAATGKTQAWRVLLTALERWEKKEGMTYVIDPKAISKDSLYGTLDSTTREWNDGLFTHILRKIVDNVRGEDAKRHWIIFDGDVDPEWVENLNSVLDDNKLLTLPNGERLNLPPNVRIMFEVESLRYATLATVSRCGMVWFSEDALTPSMLYANYLSTARAVGLDAADDDILLGDLPTRGSTLDVSAVSPILACQREIVDVIAPHFEDDGLVNKALSFAKTVDHIMDFTSARAISTLFSLINKTIRNVLEYNAQHSDFPLQHGQIEAYATKRLLVSLVWAFTGDSRLDTRAQMGDFLRNHSGLDMPPLGPGASLIDYDVQVASGDWQSWQNSVPEIDLETHQVIQSDVVIPTIDTVRHEEVLYSWLSEHKPLLLCGPPGSGKTMTLFSALRKLNNMEVVGLNFSSATTPELVLKTFEQYCEFRRTPNGVVLAPIQLGKWVVVFCDEINLPAPDKYGTQKVISFLRQLVETGGYWRPSDKAWIKLERIQFVGACNPPTDPGRVPLSHRFMRHAPLIMVDYPGEASLKQIYGTFNRAVLKLIPTLRGFSESLTSAMVDFYLASQRRFTADVQAHYVYSPRELTRWVRGVYEAIRPLETLSLDGLIRVWAHEGLRLFSDRLVAEEEKGWTDNRIDETASEHFPAINKQDALARPILFSNWTSKYYITVDREQLREFCKARLKVFYEEELDVPLVLFNDVLDHVLRIDRVFRQIQGHLLLIGVSGSGKTTLARFVAWMNGLSVFQIKVHNKYTAEDFDDDLRNVLRRAGCKGEKICFIMDESNVLDAGFLERMNTLLANAEVPGLFEGDEHAALMTACKEGAQRDGTMLDSQEELYRWFTSQVAKNLHVVFTMNPPENGLASRAATSPALFNRCVLDWFGDWSDQAFYQVGMEFTTILDLDLASYAPPSPFPVAYRDLQLPPLHRTAITNALVSVHMSMYDTNKRLARRQARFNYATPRHYLDFINNYVALFNEKRDDLEEQQRHLHLGLDKLRSTVVEVEVLRKSLANQRTQLQSKNAEANAKLQQMVADQQEAEQKKQASIQIQAALEQQKNDIAQRKIVVMEDLAEAEPAVQDAQAAVSNIKRQHLTEVRSMANPPEAVKLAMESVCTILGHKIDSWKTVQGIIRRDDFIASIVNFDTDKRMTRQLRDKMRTDFLSRPSFNFETVNRASKACGPLCKWVIAQVHYSGILDRIGPLRNEVQSLENQAATTQDQASTIVTMIAELETSIARYKEEYAALISETQTIKSEMQTIQRKVDRSFTLLESLGSEKERWEAGSATFETQMSTIAGDVLLSAAFLTYSGFFDQTYRESMWLSWSDHLTAAGIKYKSDLSLTEYLSTADDRLGWQTKSLPADDLCTENAIMLKRFNRYPLIIDPSGQATNFLQNEFKDRKLAVTSFLDEAFVKTLESALRFGTPLLVQDVEHLDPILNAVLNKELRRAGGRVLIRLGSQDIDFSPAFTMFLSTRDPSVEFSPDICSRVTFVNFTMTKSSLQSQSLNQVLRVERPDTDKKRTDLMKLQGEFKLRLRHLEKSLLQALSESSGSILDDNKVIETLETLKQEAAEVGQKVEETEIVMQEVEAVTSEYMPLAQASSSIFLALEKLNILHHFYQFSLRFFLDIFEFVLLQNPNLNGVLDARERLNILVNDLFVNTFKRTSRALLHKDHITLAMVLAQIKLRGSLTDSDDDELSFLIEGSDTTSSQPRLEIPAYLPDVVRRRVTAYSKLSFFAQLVGTFEDRQTEWHEFMQSSTPEKSVPDIWSESSILTKSIRTLLVIKCFRPDRLLQALNRFVALYLAADIGVASEYTLGQVVANEVSATSPVCLCSVPGYDASYRVESLVTSTNARCVSVAMGSQEGFSLAEQAIATATRSGTWVLLKNVHLASSWLSQLEKRLQALNPNRGFRLFLTMETSPSIPVNILRQSRIFMNEPPPGIKANLIESLKGIPEQIKGSGPAETTRLYFLLSWFHAVVQERLRYCPLGWSKIYEFNDSDLEAAFSMIDSWMSTTARGKSNIDPAALPWDALRVLIKQAIYGGRVDSDWDQRLLDSFVDRLFRPAAFDVGFKLVDGGSPQDSLVISEGSQIDHFLSWAQGLPEREPPHWLGLPRNSEALIATTQGSELLSRLLRMRSADEDDTPADSVTSKTPSSSQQPGWMRTLKATALQYLAILPATFQNAADSDSKASSDPLGRFFEREFSSGKKWIVSIRSDLEDLVAVCDGNLKQTNHIRALISEMMQGSIPSGWRKYRVHPSMTLSQWIPDFGRRLKQLSEVDADPSRKTDIALGLLFFPDGFLTASRQAVAHRTKTSLEQLKLKLELQQRDVESNSFRLRDFTLECAALDEGQVRLNEGDNTALEPVSLRWVDTNDVEDTKQSIHLPCYLDSSRSHLLFTAVVPSVEDSFVVSQRGVALRVASQ